MKCEHCGAPLPQDAKVCPVCGQAQDSIPQDLQDEVTAAMEQAQAILDHPAPAGPQPPQEEPKNSLPAQEESPAPEVSPIPRMVDPPIQDDAAQKAAIPEPIPVPQPQEPGPEKAGEAPPDAPPQPDPQPDPQPGQEPPETPPPPTGPVYARGRKSRPPRRRPPQDTSVPSTWQYFLLQLVLGLPLIGLILSLIWGLEEGGPAHRRNFARANILYTLLRILFKLVIIGILISMFSSFISMLMSYGYYYSDPYDPYYDDYFGWYGDDYYGYDPYGESPYYYNSSDTHSYWEEGPDLSAEGTIQV